MNGEPETSRSTIRPDRRPRAGGWPIVDAVAPPERLAALRVVAGVFTLGYFVIRLPVFLQLRERAPEGFDGVGMLAPFSAPLGSTIVTILVVATIASGVAFIVGGWFRLSGPTFALGMLVLTTFRGSWGQLLHFENLMVLHLIVLACSPAADVWSLDGRRRSRSPGTSESSARYGWPIALVGLVTVVTYMIAGIAKLRYGGIDWIVGDTLRNHIAYSAARLDLLGGTPAPAAEFAVRHAWMLPPLAAVSVVLELAAPVAFLGPRIRNGWVTATWLMHGSIFLLMFVGFPSPLFGVAFAPFFHLERIARLPEKCARLIGCLPLLNG